MKTSTFVVLMAAVAGTMQNREKISHWLNPPVPLSESAQNKNVVLYSTTWCGYCAKTREYFAENHIKYKELDVETSEKGRADYQRLGGNGIPIVVINKETVIHGYNPDSIREALNNPEAQ